MAASGLAQLVEAAAVEMAMDRKNNNCVRLLQVNGIFSPSFDKNGMHNDSDIVSKCLERLNGTLPSATIEPFLKSSLSQKFNGFNFDRETFAARIGRSPSTDSIGGSNFSSDQGSVDSCNYSSHGSDSNSGSAPCSPEEPDRFSRAGTPQPMPPIPPSLQDDSQSEEDQPCQIGHHKLDVKDNMCTESRTAVDDFCGGNERVHFSQQKCSDKTKNRTDPVTSPKEMKHFYLEQSSCSVPNSKYQPFQRAKSLSYVPSHEQTSDGSSSNSSNKTLGHSKMSVHSELAFPFAKQNSRQLNFPSCNSANQSNCSSTEIQQCNWVDCKTCVEGNAELVEHIRSQHVQTQMNKESFVCLWAGCKVYNRASCSLSWLERHILSHGGNKPFKCIVDNCSQRFPTQAALQRHVNSHFDNQQSNNHGSKTSKCRDEVVIKSFRRKKHHKYKRRNAVGKTEDFFDANIMEQIRYKLVEVNSSPSLGSTNNPGTVTFYSRIKARRTEKSGKVNVLLQWIPENVLPDSWVPEESVIKCKRVPYSSLPVESLALLDPRLKEECDVPRVKRRRK